MLLLRKTTGYLGVRRTLRAMEEVEWKSMKLTIGYTYVILKA